MKKPGPRPKADRVQFTFRLPRDHKAAYEREADQLGLALSDYVTLMLARAHEFEDPDYVVRQMQHTQEALPLSA